MKKKQIMVRNDAAPKAAAIVANSLQRLTINFLPAQTRIELLEDRPHTVIPMVMMVEGVHIGSSGPIYYSPEELGKTPEIWNQKPIVVYHPEINGQGCSACDPSIVNSRKVGVMMNTTWDAKTKKLKSEAWLEKPRADKVDNRIFEAIIKNSMMEVSTGLFVDLEEGEGKWKEETYNGIARNLRPDHLAILPDMIGACSISDGAGLLRNAAREMQEKDKKGFDQLITQLQAMGLPNLVSTLTGNELSFSNIRETLSNLIRAKVNPNKTDSGPYTWVADVYSNFFIYELGTKLFMLGYTASDIGVSLSEDASVEVYRVTEYRTVTGAKFIGNLEHQQQDKQMNRIQKIAAILAVANCGWTQKELDVLTDNNVDFVHKNIATPTPPAPPTVPAAPQNNQLAPATPAPIAPAAPAPTPPPAPVTLESYIALAPPQFQEPLRNMHLLHETERNSLIAKITSNAQSGFTAEELKTWTVENLRRVANLAVPVALVQPYPGNYSGMAPAAPTNNQPKEQVALALPTMNFKKEAKAA